VTIYGTLDAGYSKSTLGAPAVAGSNKFGQLNGNDTAAANSFHNPSRIGFKGTEDLGGGLKANFNLETGGLNMGTGGTAFDTSRESWVGLEGAFGSTRIGRTSSVATQANAAFDFNHISTSSAMASVGISPVTWYGSSRRSSQFQYSTPTVSGFSAGLGYVAAGDNADTGAAGQFKASTQARVNYANGPLAVGFTTETARKTGARTASALFASYDLGVAKIGAGSVTSETAAATYSSTTGGVNGGKGSYFNVDVPFGAFNVGAQYAKNTASKDDATELYARYTLSKRTFVYLDTVKIDFKGAGSFANTTGGKSVNKTGVGIMHNF
jgi:predicted porin